MQPFDYKRPEPLPLPEFKFVELTVSQVKAMTDAELLAVLSGEDGQDAMVPQPLQQLITSELLTRALSRNAKPHWSVVPSFWLLVSATILALIAAAAAVLGLPYFSSSRAEQPVQAIPKPDPARLPPSTPSGKMRPNSSLKRTNQSLCD